MKDLNPNQHLLFFFFVYKFNIYELDYYTNLSRLILYSYLIFYLILILYIPMHNFSLRRCSIVQVDF